MIQLDTAHPVHSMYCTTNTYFYSVIQKGELQQLIKTQYQKT